MNRIACSLVLAIAGLAPMAAFGAQPNPVTNLQVVSAAHGEITLQWTSPAGLPSGSHWLDDYCYYELRHAPVDPAGSVDAWWEGATPWPATPVPKVSGSPESMTLVGINPHEVTWFVIRSYDGTDKEDEIPGWSDYSNVAVAFPEDPDPPLAPLQFKRNGATVIPRGGSTDQSAFVVKAQLSDPAGRPCRLQVEVKAGNDVLDAGGIVTGGETPSGSTASVTVNGLAPSTSFRWRARAINSIDGTSGWVDYGMADLGQIDLATLAVDPPTAPSARQYGARTGAAIEVGDKVIGDELSFQALLTQGEDHDAKLEVEVQPVGVPFTNVATGTGPAVPAGGIGSVTQRLAPDLYHWQWRAVETEWDIASAWVSFGANAEDEADFDLQAGGSSGNTQLCSGSVAGGSCAWIAGAAVVALLLLKR